MIGRTLRTIAVVTSDANGLRRIAQPFVRGASDVECVGLYAEDGSLRPQRRATYFSTSDLSLTGLVPVLRRT